MITEKLVKTPTTSLYGLNCAFADALANVQIDEETGEIVGLDQVRELEIATGEKITNCARFVRDLECLVDGMKKAKAEIDARIKSRQRIIDAIKAEMLFSMTQLNAKKLEQPDVVISLRKTSSVDIYDESLLPDDCFVEKVKREVSKTAIKDKLKTGEDVQGARIIEKMSVNVK